MGAILQDTAHTIRMIHHIETQASPSQLVFGRDILSKIPHTSNWENITAQK